MEFDVRSTPRSYEHSRSLYERSVADANESRVLSIGLDTAIDSVRGMIIDQSLHVPDAIQAVEFLSKVAIMRGSKNAATDTFTDYNRVMSTAMFARERTLAPLIYSLEGPRAIEARSKLSDGSEGISTELINEYLRIIGSLEERGFDDQIRQIRGVIQEHTVASLLNFDQTSSRLCVPATTYDDITRQTDLYEYYYDAVTEVAYCHDISVKSTRGQKMDEQQWNPGMIVIAAEEFGNLDLSISDLLVRNSQGAPGLNTEEMARLRMAKNTVVNLLKQQAVGREFDTLTPLHDEALEAQFIAA